MRTICVVFALNAVMNMWYLTDAYAQLADTMLCADKECSETISEGKARLAYRPRDDKFLNLEKGDVVLVKSKNAGKKSHLWGGQVMGSNRFGFFPSSFIKEYIVLVKKPKYNVSIKEFLKSVNGYTPPDVYAGLIGENQRITVDKSRKKKSNTQSDTRKKDIEEVNAPSSADSGSAEGKTGASAGNEVANKPADDSTETKQEKPTPSKDESNDPIRTQQFSESNNEGTNTKISNEDNAKSSQTATPIPPHIAAIMEESLKSSQKTDDTKVESKPDQLVSTEKNDISIDHSDDLSQLGPEARLPSDEESPGRDLQAMKLDQQTETKEHLSDSNNENGIDSDGRSIALEESGQTTPSHSNGEINNPSSTEVKSTEGTKEEDTSDKLKPLTDITQEASQPMHEHEDVSSINAEIGRTKETLQTEKSVPVTTSLEDAGSGKQTGDSVEYGTGTEKQEHAAIGENEVKPGSEQTLKPAQAEFVNESSNDNATDDQNTDENDMTVRGQDIPDNMLSDEHQVNGDASQSVLTDEDNEPFEDDVDDDFEIEYLTVSHKEMNNEMVVEPQGDRHNNAEQESIKSNSQTVEEQSSAQNMDTNSPSDHTKLQEPEHSGGDLNNDTVTNSENTGTQETVPHSSTDEIHSVSEVDSVHISNSESDGQAERQISEEGYRYEDKFDRAHEEVSTSEKLTTDVSALESDGDKTVLPKAEDGLAKDDIKPDGSTKINEAEQATNSHDSQSEESGIQLSPDDSAEHSVGSSDSQTTDTAGKHNNGSGGNQTEQSGEKISKGSFNYEDISQQTHEETSTSTDKLLTDLSAFESDGKNAVLPTAEGEMAKDSMQSDKPTEFNKKEQDTNGSDEQPEESSNPVNSDDSVEPSIVNGNSKSPDRADGHNDGSGSKQTDQSNDSVETNILGDSQQEKLELTDDDKPESHVSIDDEVTPWDHLQQEMPTELPKAGILSRASSSDTTEDILQSSSNETRDSSKTSSSDEGTNISVVGTQSPDDSKEVEPAIDTEKMQSSAEADKLSPGFKESPDEGDEIGSGESGVQVGSAFDETEGDKRDNLHDFTSTSSQGEETTSGDGRNMTDSNGSAAVNESEGIINGTEKTTTEEDIKTSSVEKDVPLDVDRFEGEEKVSDSQDTSSQLAVDQFEEPKTHDIPNLKFPDLHSLNIPPAGPPPKSISVTDKDTKPAGEVTVEDSKESAPSQSDSTVSEGVGNTAQSSVSSDKVLEENKDSAENVLQMDSMSKGIDAKSDKSGSPDVMEQLGGDDVEAGKYKVLHEGKLVDWDETIEEKPKDKQPLTWDEAIGDDTEDIQKELAPDRGQSQDHEVQRHPTPLQSKADETPPEDVTVATPTPAQEDVTEQQVEATPHSIKDTITERVEATEQSSSITLENEKAAEDTIFTKPQVNQDVTVSPPSINLTEDAVGDSPAVASVDGMTGPDDAEDLDEAESVAKESEQDNGVESFWLRIIFVLSSIPGDIVYICEPLFEMLLSLLPLEYQDGVLGVSWPVIFSTLFLGLVSIFLLMCRSHSNTVKRRKEEDGKRIQELQEQNDELSKKNVVLENDLKMKKLEMETQEQKSMKLAEDTEGINLEKSQLENSLHQFESENKNLKRRVQELFRDIEDKDVKMQQISVNAHQAQEKLRSQEDALVSSNNEIKRLQTSIDEQENMKKDSDLSIDKLKERIKNLEKSKGEAKKEAKVLKDQIEKLNGTIGNLQQTFDAAVEDGEQRRQEIDVLKDCILQFKGVKEILADEDDEDIESEESLAKQKEKMKAMVDVANIKKMLRQIEAEKLQVTYELEAEKESRVEKENRVTELEAVIQGEEVVKSKLQRDVQNLESKVDVMKDFYAKREVEIQSKLGLEKSKLESNMSLLENKENEQSELLSQLRMYKQMCQEAKQTYEDSERKHKQEVVGFEKKAHENWLARREAERKYNEATNNSNRLQLEVDDLKIRLHEERSLIIRPRPERHGPPGGPPPFVPPRRHMMPLGSPISFRNGPPDTDRRSPPPHRSPGGSIPGDRPPSRPDRPPSTHSLPPFDRRPPSGPPIDPGYPYGGTPGRPPYRDGPHPARPPPRGSHPHGRPPSGPILRASPGPMTSSPYMERPPIAPSQSPRGLAFMQSSLHATPPQPPVEGLRTDGQKPPLKGAPLGPPNSNSGGGNPFRRSKS